MGYAFNLGGAVVSWESMKQRTAAFLSTEAKNMALTHGYFVQNILCELLGKRESTTLYNDSLLTS
jgi:hypothetical protein